MTPGSPVWLAPQIRLVQAPNPSAMTGPGTNSYILGQGGGVVVIDPGPEDAGHLSALLAALGPGERVEAILVTHSHRDHSALTRPLSQATGAPVLAFGRSGSGRSPLMRRLVAEGLAGGGEGVDAGFAPDRTLRDGEVVHGDGWQVTALHTPGHMDNHVCYAFGDVLFTGDHVMGWSSTLISPPDGDMGAYMASLAALQAREWSRFLPGHGAPVDTPAARLAELVAHRQARAAAILAAIQDSPDTALGLVQRLYTDTPPALHPAAQRNVLAQLIDLTERNLVSPTPGPLAEATFHHSVGA